MDRSGNGDAGDAGGFSGAEADREPIGFSDLEPDEALLISLFRRWRHDAPTRAIAAHMLAIRLRCLDYHQYTDSFLNVFKSIGPAGDGPERVGHPLLAPEEEVLIGRVAALASGPAGGAVERLPSAAAIPLSVRPVETIPRSGRDRLEMTIARSYGLVHARLRAWL